MKKLFFNYLKESDVVYSAESKMVNYGSHGSFLRSELIWLWRKFFTDADSYEFTGTNFTSKESLEKSQHTEFFKNNLLFTSTGLVFRPETCSSIFAWIRKYHLERSLVNKLIFQVGYSFRVENTSKGFLERLGEFTQLELEMISNTDKVEDLKFKIIKFLKILNLDYTVVHKTDLPHYSSQTIDFETSIFGHNLQLLCLNVRNKNKLDCDSEYPIYEVSMGLDRLIWAYCEKKWRNNKKLKTPLIRKFAYVSKTKDYELTAKISRKYCFFNITQYSSLFQKLYLHGVQSIIYFDGKEHFQFITDETLPKNWAMTSRSIDFLNSLVNKS